MPAWRSVLLSLPVVAVLLGGLTLGLVYLGRLWNFGVATLFLLVVPILLAAVYLWWYGTLPYEPRAETATPVPAPAEEPFADPVEEADRYDREARAGPPPEEPAVVDDDPATDAPPPP